MAVTLSLRAGQLWRAHINYWQPGKTELVDTTGSYGRLTLSSTTNPRRTILQATDDPDDDVALQTGDEPGQWIITFDRTVTNSFPPTTIIELELISSTDPDDVTPLVDGVIRTQR